MNSRIVQISLILVACLLSACNALHTGPQHGTHNPEHMDMMPAASAESIATPVAGEISVVNPIARTAPLAGGNSAVYFTITNGRTDAMRMVDAASPAAASVEIHKTVADGDIMRMVHLADGLEIPPNGGVELRPGGKHIMLIDLESALAQGDTLALTLYLLGADDEAMTIELEIPVGEPNGDNPHHHHGS